MSQEFLPFARPLIDEATIESVAQVLRSGWLTGGPQVMAFERALSVHCGDRPVRSFASGTAALEAALRLAGIGSGDEVVTTPLTWVATANAIVSVGARPVFVDVERSTRNINLDQVASVLSSRVRAILPVDLAGLPVDRDRLAQLAEVHGVRVIEDAAQSFGSSWNGRAIGSFGDFVVFSFHANKNITCGEGGALVLPADVDPQACERLRLQGVRRSSDGLYDVEEPGMKANLSEVAATIGLGQLRCLGDIQARRARLAQEYFSCLPSHLGLELPVADFLNGNWHMFQVLLPAGVLRADFIRKMSERGIGVGVHYPAVHLLSMYRRLGYRAGDFPVAEDVAGRTVSLPLHVGMDVADVHRVVSAMVAVIG